MKKICRECKKTQWVSQHQQQQSIFLRTQTFCTSPGSGCSPDTGPGGCAPLTYCRGSQENCCLLNPWVLTLPALPYWNTSFPETRDKHVGPIYYMLRVNSSSGFRARCCVGLVPTTLETSPLCLHFSLLKSHTCSWLTPIPRSTFKCSACLGS